MQSGISVFEKSGRAIKVELIGLNYARFLVAPGRVALPDVCCDLILVDGTLLLAGPSSHARAVPSTAGEVHLVGLDTLSVHAALGTPVAELTDRILPLADIQPRAVAPLIDALAAGRGASLVRTRTADDRPDRMVEAANLLAAGTSVRQTAEAVNLSQRQLERRFLEATGLRPRTYRQISRLRKALCIAAAGESLAAAASVAGFADQAHFSRETRSFTGSSPSTLLRNVAKVQDRQVWLR